MKTRIDRWRPDGYSLIDTLMVMAILGLLLQLLLPAVQATRESARRMQCSSRLRQIGLAFHAHQQAKGHYPSGGWHFHWVGEPERGTGPSQPGSWAYNLLDYVGESELRRIGSGLTGEARTAAIARRCAQPLALFYCPTRRAAKPYPHQSNRLPITRGGRLMQPLDWAAKTDYAANCGDSSTVEYDWQWPGPQSLEEGDRPSFTWPSTHERTGIVFGRSKIRPRQILDGQSKTYLVGEKFIDTQHYTSGNDWGDNENLYAGFNNDNCRSTATLPHRDRPRKEYKTSFGSAHPSVWNVVMCDGSVQARSFAIDPTVHRRGGNRRDRPVTKLSRRSPSTPTDVETLRLTMTR